MAALSLTRLSEASPLQKHRIKQNYPLFVAYKVIAKGHGRLPTFLFASLALPVHLIVSTEEYAAGRGGPTQELNNNFQQSSQEAGSPDCGCSLLSSFLPPHSPTLLPSPPSSCWPMSAPQDWCILQTSALKETQATFLSPESLQWTEPLKQEQSPSFPASQSRACAFFRSFFFLKLKTLTWCEMWANKQAEVCWEALTESLAAVFQCCCLWRCLWCFLYSLSSAISVLGNGSIFNTIVMIIFLRHSNKPNKVKTLKRQCDHWGCCYCLWCPPQGHQKVGLRETFLSLIN